MPLTPSATAELRQALTRMVRTRVPAQDAEDIVQSALIEAIGSPHAPQEPEALRRWLFGVAKNKIVDFHRKHRRETFDLPDVEAEGAAHEEKDLLRWAEESLPEGREAEQTLEWMLREGEGEKLEAIAASEKLPAPRVRQRVSRLRRHLKANWQKEVAVLAALGIIATLVLLYVKKKDEPITHEVRPVPSASLPGEGPLELARRARARGLERCNQSDWGGCVKDLDEAKGLDPAGDTAPAVVKARDDARRVLDPSPVPTAPSAAPSAVLPPVPTTETTAVTAPSGFPSKMDAPKTVAKPQAPSLSEPKAPLMKNATPPAPPQVQEEEPQQKQAPQKKGVTKQKSGDFSGSK